MGWSAAISFLVRPFRSAETPAGTLGTAGTVGTLGTLFGRGDSIAGTLICFKKALDQFIKERLHFAEASIDVGPGAFENFTDFPGQPVGLIDTANLRIAIPRPQYSG